MRDQGGLPLPIFFIIWKYGMGSLLETASWACSPSITAEDRGIPPTTYQRLVNYNEHEPEKTISEKTSFPLLNSSDNQCITLDAC